uniref:Uncharacterized protein n=1 Tax=Schistocephalus solidus TaxID=70667 RepID=A0A0X3PTP3_SCHSO
MSVVTKLFFRFEGCASVRARGVLPSDATLSDKNACHVVAAPGVVRFVRSLLTGGWYERGTLGPYFPIVCKAEMDVAQSPPPRVAIHKAPPTGISSDAAETID